MEVTVAPGSVLCLIGRYLVPGTEMRSVVHAFNIFILASGPFSFLLRYNVPQQNAQVLREQLDGFSLVRIHGYRRPDQGGARFHLWKAPSRTLSQRDPRSDSIARLCHLTSDRLKAVVQDVVPAT